MESSVQKVLDSGLENGSATSRKRSLIVKLRTPDLLPLYGQLVSNLTNQTSSLKKQIAHLDQKNQKLASIVVELNKAEKTWTETVFKRITELKMENDSLKRRNWALEEDNKRLTRREEELQHTPETHLVQLRKKLENEYVQRNRMHEAVIAQMKAELEVERARTEEYRETMKRFKQALEGQI